MCLCQLLAKQNSKQQSSFCHVTLTPSTPERVCFAICCGETPGSRPNGKGRFVLCSTGAPVLALLITVQVEVMMSAVISVHGICGMGCPVTSVPT